MPNIFQKIFPIYGGESVIFEINNKTFFVTRTCQRDCTGLDI